MNAPSEAFIAFSERFAEGAPQLISRVLIADTQTPVSAYMRLASGKPNSFLLESVEGGEIRGRFSVIGMAPDLIWRCRGNLAEINRNPSESSDFEAVAELTVTPATLPDGKNVFRILTQRMPADTAAQICEALWQRMVGCLLKAVP